MQGIRFFRRTGELWLQLLMCRPTAALTSTCLPLLGNNLNTCKCLLFPSRLTHCFVSQDMLDAFEAIQGKFRQIQSLTRRQKDQLKRFCGGNETSSGNCNSFQNQLFSQFNYFEGDVLYQIRFYYSVITCGRVPYFCFVFYTSEIISSASLTFWTIADFFSKNSGTWVMPALKTMWMINHAPWWFILKSVQYWNTLLLCWHWMQQHWICNVWGWIWCPGLWHHVPQGRKSRQNLVFFPPFVRSAVLHAHPVHRPHRRGRETLFHCAEVSGWHPTPALVPGILRRQPWGQGLSGLSQQIEPEIPTLCWQRIWLPEQ